MVKIRETGSPEKDHPAGFDPKKGNRKRQENFAFYRSGVFC